MKIMTSNFGEIEIPEENMIYFENGIPGFNEYKKYIIVNDEEKDSPFCWLQSAEDPELSFAMVNPYLVYDGYDPKFPQSQLGKLGEASPEDYSVLSTLVIPEDIKKMRTNLMAPIVINIKTRKAMQIIQDGEEYPVKYYLYKELQKMAK